MTIHRSYKPACKFGLRLNPRAKWIVASSSWTYEWTNESTTSSHKQVGPTSTWTASKLAHKKCNPQVVGFASGSPNWATKRTRAASNYYYIAKWRIMSGLIANIWWINYLRLITNCTNQAPCNIDPKMWIIRNWRLGTWKVQWTQTSSIIMKWVIEASFDRTRLKRLYIKHLRELITNNSKRRNFKRREGTCVWRTPKTKRCLRESRLKTYTLWEEVQIVLFVHNFGSMG